MTCLSQHPAGARWGDAKAVVGRRVTQWRHDEADDGRPAGAGECHGNKRSIARSAHHWFTPTFGVQSPHRCA